jgi:NAD(P)-dependent dehydrogenase (short-subunit alcohol dehydrogenase family)
MQENTKTPQPHPLAQQVALVTGGSRGLGAAIATRLARDGARVLVNYRSGRDAAEKLAQSLRGESFTAEACQCDVANATDVKVLFQDIEARYERLDILVNNAGINHDGPFLEMSLEREIPLLRLGTGDEIAAAVAFLCSSEASFITGQTLAVNGGHFMNP